MRLTRLFLTFAVLVITACSENGGSSVLDRVNTANGGANLLDRAAQAMGGSAALQAVQNQRVVASGTWFEPEQTFRPSDEPLQVSTFQYTLTHDLSADRFRYDYDWNHHITPYNNHSVITLAFAEVVDGDQGIIIRAATGFSGSPVPRAMPSVRLATLRKFNRLTSPLVLLRAALADPAGAEVRPDELFEGKSYHVLALTREQPRPIRLFIAPDTFLPVKADTLEDDPYYGDTLHEVLYSDWRQQGTVMTPFNLTQRLTGLGRTVTLQNEVRTAVENDVAIPVELFAIPAELRLPADAAEMARGERMAQWFLRCQAINIPMSIDQGLAVTITETRPGSGVFFVKDSSHNSLIVEQADHLIIVEPALHESRSQAVIAEIKRRFPGKPIRYVVVSHFHIEHGGGVRAYAAEGATVVVGAASRAHFEEILAAPHTVFPDALQNHPRPVEVLAVPDEGLQLSGGAVGVYPVLNQTHAADMVVPFVPAEGLLFVSDLLTPSATPLVTPPLPSSLLETFARFNLVVTAIASGHGGITKNPPAPFPG